MPTTESEIRDLAAGSAALVRDALGIPNMPLKVDGSDIRIPFSDHTEGHMDWMCRKKYYAMVLQGVCDYRSHFRNVQAGWPGSVHDARVFRNSTVGQAILAGTVFGGLTHSLPDGTKLDMAVGADAAYPKCKSIIKPHTDGGTLTNPQMWFDYCQSVQRQPIERAYGRTKGRWRCLLLRTYNKLEQIPSIIIACCVLHNICEMSNEDFDEALLPDSESDDDDDVVNGLAGAEEESGEQMRVQRAALCAYLWQHAPAEVKLLGVREWRKKYGRFVRRRDGEPN
jgi:hypothetical protein